MAEITNKRAGELKQAVLKALSQHPDGLPAREAIVRVEKICPATSFENSDYPKRPGMRRFGKMVRFTTIAPVKAGWMIKAKGIWKITEEGKRALENFRDPEQLQREATRLYHEWRKSRPSDEEPEEEAPTAASTFEEASESAWAEIREYLGKINPYDFQDLISGLLKAMGYFVSWVAPAGQDGGIDLIAHRDPLGTEAPRIKVQAKRRADKVDVDTIKAFLSSLGNQDVGIFVALGGFTSHVESTVRSQENRLVTLIDFERLMDLWIEHYNKLEESSRQLLPLKPIYYLAPNE